jgi:hypothetical protein
MTELNHMACRNLESSVLHQAIKDVAYGAPEQRERAQWWIAGPNADHIAEQLGITNWPPDEDCYDRELKAHLKRGAIHMGVSDIWSR